MPAYDLMMVAKSKPNPLPLTRLKLGAFSLWIGVMLVGGCASPSVRSESTQIEQITTTTVLNDDELGAWLTLSLEKVTLPKIAGLSRNQATMKFSEFRYALSDFVVVSRKNPDVRISRVGADWIAEIEESISAFIESSIMNNSGASADALGRYNYLVSQEKRELVANCIIDIASC